MQSSPWHTSWILETGSVVDFGGGAAHHGADVGVVAAAGDDVAPHESELDVDIVDLACLGSPP